MTKVSTDIERINALTNNARNTWFVLLGVLVFVGITLMGIEHIDFYGVKRATQLPLVNVEVPTRLFFIAAPILIAAVYGYFHLYLIRLWDVLSSAAAKQNKRRLGDEITPWLVTDAALHLRESYRKDGCVTPRNLERAAMVLNLAIAWLFGLLVVAALWWLSMPARNFGMTLASGSALIACLWTGTTSLVLLMRRMKRKQSPSLGLVLSPEASVLVAFLLIIATSIVSFQRTSGPKSRLADVQLIEQPLVILPTDWVPYELAKKNFEASWCKTHHPSEPSKKGYDCRDLTRKNAQFNEDWIRHKRSIERRIVKPWWNGLDDKKPDLRFANLEHSVLAGINLRDADMAEVKLRKANAESAVFVDANFANAVATNAQMASAHFGGASFENTNLRKADFFEANTVAAHFDAANLYKTDFEGAQMSYTFFENMPSERYTTGNSGPSMYKTNFSDADFSFAAFRGANLNNIVLGNNHPLRDTFLDKSVTLPKNYSEANETPCQWFLNEKLSDEDFFLVWRWWAEQRFVQGYTRWKRVAPKGWENHPVDGSICLRDSDNQAVRQIFERNNKDRAFWESCRPLNYNEKQTCTYIHSKLNK